MAGEEIPQVQRYAVVKDGEVIEVINWDGAADYMRGDDVELMLEADAIAQEIPFNIPLN